MLIRRIAEKTRGENWLTLGLELALVVVGILLAFQLDRAYQASQDRALEQRYLARLSEDLRRDSAEIADNLARTDVRLRQVALLERVVGDPSLATGDPLAFVKAMEQVTWRSVPTITTGTFDELRTTGRSVLLRSEELRRNLADYYAFLEEQGRLGLGEDDQDRFRLETLGLRSGDHLASVEDPGRFPFEVSADDATEIARGFASRPAGHLWLGLLAKYPVLMHRLSGDFESRNARLRSQVDSLLRVGS